MSDHALDAKIESLIFAVIAAEKQILGPMRWRTKERPDYSSCRMMVFCPEYPQVYLRLAMVTERRRLPQKSSITLLFGRYRIFSLDTEPRRWHNNRGLLGSVRVTHWHSWPCVAAIPDDRSLPHKEWFDAFLSKSNSKYDGYYKGPPYEPEQLVLI